MITPFRSDNLDKLLRIVPLLLLKEPFIIKISSTDLHLFEAVKEILGPIKVFYYFSPRVSFDLILMKGLEWQEFLLLCTRTFHFTALQCSLWANI